MDDRVARAAVHAALGEPVRLAVAEALLLGDRSPGELAAALGQGSNLLAHHLNVLQRAGVVRRQRSEADRRRSYVRLSQDPVVTALVAAGGPAQLPGPVRRVVFVCTHNSARSHLAAAAWERVSTVPVASAGTAPADEVNPRAVAAGARRGLDLSHRRTSHVADVVTSDDLVVAVCDNAYETSLRQADAPAVPLHWSVPDPVALGTDEAFERALTEIVARVDRLGHHVTSVRRDPR